ncbi:MAG: transcriptional repressor [Clostridia bacterium]|nr:transcriptional repressor [Clostridia bacterium]
MTKQKKIILDIINNSCCHPTAEEIYVKAREIMPSIALGTVYRNLGIMTNGGEIRRIVCEGAPDRFDKISPHHDHMQCIRCGRINDTDIGRIIDIIKGAVGEKVCGYELMIKHVCADCEKEQK